jgi:hypothetical protein
MTDTTNTPKPERAYIAQLREAIKGREDAEARARDAERLRAEADSVCEEAYKDASEVRERADRLAEALERTAQELHRKKHDWTNAVADFKMCKVLPCVHNAAALAGEGQAAPTEA